MDLNTAVICRQVEGVRFGMYTDDEVRARSVIEITSPQAFDALGTPLPNGLYDPLLGPSESRSNCVCPTCSNVYVNCPGHAGHIELCVPVYHPLIFPKLISLLRIKCLACHSFRLEKRQTRIFAAKLHLIDLGRYHDAMNLDEQISSVAHKAMLAAKNDEEQNSDALKSSQTTDATAIVAEGSIDGFLTNLLATPLDRSITLTSHERSTRRQLAKDFVAACMSCKKCNNCGAYSPKIRQDSFNKIFQVPLAEQSRQRNVAERIKIVPAAELVRNNSDQLNASRPTGWNSDDTDIDEEELELEVKSNIAEDLEDNNDNIDDVLMGRKMREASVSSKLDSRHPKPDKFMHALEVEAQVRLTWTKDPFLCSKIFGCAHDASQYPSLGVSLPQYGWGFFFMRVVSVPPARFRPPMIMGTMTVEHSQNHYLSKILALNDSLRTFLATIQLIMARERKLGKEHESTQAKAISTWIDLQTTVNCYIDSSRDPSAAATSDVPSGIRQILEKKEGIFRKHMMGKRVNYACRSVISPDPYIGTNEIGIPLYFAKALTYPVPVTSMNVAEMRKLIIRGPNNYPGASWVELPNGQKLDLTKMQQQKREALAARLLSRTGVVKVGRQLRNGDMVLMNRQPSLHKPSIMAHCVRVLHSPTQKTIRMHYANCDTYNADYDGDEMNCHFPQNDLARAESEFIVKTDLQYIVPTDGSPLRGLIQDHVDAGVKLTSKDTFLEKWQYQQLTFSCLSSLSGLELIQPDVDVQYVPPAIMKPRSLWTGKQVITTLLQHLRNSHGYLSSSDEVLPGIYIEMKAKTPESAFGSAMQEHLVLIQNGELLRGVLDKASFGASEFSLVHGVYEAYGPSKAGLLLNALGRLFTAYLQFFSGHSCRMEDLILSPDADRQRQVLVQRVYNIGTRAAKAWAESDGGKVDIPSVCNRVHADKILKPFETATTSAKISYLLSGKEGKENSKSLDAFMQGELNPQASDLIKACLPNGLAVPFPINTFSLMVMTGAKGSTVNQSQISCALGQQALEGRRVPRMCSGKTLPSFVPFDPSPRADGFIADRFLTGIRPQEYYFHCMAGREGLVDTAVKTSRSGYLQRCLVKHLEELKVAYDHTVRDGEGGVVQFLYGEDGVDPMKSKYLVCSVSNLQFMARNENSLRRRYVGLPHSSLAIALADSEKANLLINNAPRLLQKGSFVKARKLRHGSEFKRGTLCRGWFGATITKVYDNENVFDIKYAQDGTSAFRVPLEVELSCTGGRLTRASSNVCTLIVPAVHDPILCSSLEDRSRHRIGSSGSCVSEIVAASTNHLLSSNASLHRALNSSKVKPDDVTKIVANKYACSLCAPGEAVGCIAAQSLGEPSTQMTLNTFHLAGAGANVTLGIPRLREILMTASKDLKTPTMSVPLHPMLTSREAIRLARNFSKLNLMELIASHRGITVTENLQQNSLGLWERAYYIRLKLHPAERIKEAFGFSLEDIASIVSWSFMPNLSRFMTKELKRMKADDSVSSSVAGAEYLSVSTTKNSTSSKRSKDYDEDDEDAAGIEDGVAASRFAHKKEMASYGDMDDDEKLILMDTERDDATMLYEYDEAPTLVTDEEDASDKDAGSTDFSQTLRIDERKDVLILQPLRVDPSARPLLMVGLVERAASSTLIRSRSGIARAFIEEEDGRGRCLTTSGCNFEEIWRLDEVDHSRLNSNDIWAVRCTYGVEAARMSIVCQIRGVFAAYGISIDSRHLTLIADYMTYDGGFKAMNRIGMSDISSAFLQMSFETTANFMVEAALTVKHDPIMSPSANIVIGRPIKHGTGAFECLVNA